MVPDEIKAAEMPGGLAHDVARELVAGQVARQADRFAAGGGDLPHHRVGGFLVQIDDGDRGALRGEADSAGAAHAGGGGGDDADFVFQAHCYFLR